MSLSITYLPEETSRMNAEEIIQSFDTNAEKGLTDEIVRQRLQQFGLNEIETNKRASAIVELLLHFRSPLVIILLVASVVSISLGEPINASIIFIMVIISVAIDYFQERGAKNAAERLKQTVKNKVTVLRNSVEKEILPEQLC